MDRSKIESQAELKLLLLLVKYNVISKDAKMPKMLLEKIYLTSQPSSSRSLINLKHLHTFHSSFGGIYLGYNILMRNRNVGPPVGNHRSRKSAVPPAVLTSLILLTLIIKLLWLHHLTKHSAIPLKPSAEFFSNANRYGRRTRVSSESFVVTPRALQCGWSPF